MSSKYPSVSSQQVQDPLVNDDDKREYIAWARARFSVKLTELRELREQNQSLWSQIFELEDSVVRLEGKGVKYVQCLANLEQSFRALNEARVENHSKGHSSSSSSSEVHSSNPQFPSSRIQKSRNDMGEIFAPSSDEAFAWDGALSASSEDNHPNDSSHRLLQSLIDRLSKINYEIGEVKLANERLAERIQTLQKDELELEEQHQQYRLQIESLQTCLEELNHEVGSAPLASASPSTTPNETSKVALSPPPLWSSVSVESSTEYDYDNESIESAQGNHLNPILDTSQEESIRFDLNETWIQQVVVPKNDDNSMDNTLPMENIKHPHASPNCPQDFDDNDKHHHSHMVECRMKDHDTNQSIDVPQFDAFGLYGTGKDIRPPHSPQVYKEKENPPKTKSHRQTMTKSSRTDPRRAPSASSSRGRRWRREQKQYIEI